MKKIQNRILTLLLLATGLFFLGSCERQLDVRSDYPFKVECLPVPDKVVKGEKVEMRMSLMPEKKVTTQTYMVRFFSPRGKGKLYLGEDLLHPNDRYAVTSGDFRMYYVPTSEGEHTLDLYFEDNSGNRQVMKFAFQSSANNSEKADETGNTGSNTTGVISTDGNTPTSGESAGGGNGQTGDGNHPGTTAPEVLTSGYWTMNLFPVRSALSFSQTAELKFELQSRDLEKNRKLTIRYFQRKGEGVLLSEDGQKVEPNRRYPIDQSTFVYYFHITRMESVGEFYPAQHLQFVIEDNYLQKQTIDQTFNMD